MTGDTRTTATESGPPMADIREMLIIHRAFRREFAFLPAAVRAVPEGDRARVKIVAAHANLMLTGLHLHHMSEDVELWPRLSARVRTSADLTARMENEHQGLASLVEEAGRLLPRWQMSAENPEPVAQVLEALHTALLAHLGGEEAEILPLVAEHITAAEWALLGRHARRGMRIAQAPAMFGAVLEECTPSERAMLLDTLSPALRLLIRPVMEPIYRRYITKVRAVPTHE